MRAAAPPELDGTRQVLRGQNLIRLEWAARQLLAGGLNAAAAPVADLRGALSVAGGTAGPVLVDPRFGSWLRQLVRLIERRAPLVLPDGAFRASCAAAGSFAAAARILSSRVSGAAVGEPQWSIPTWVRIGRGGRTPLPGAGLVLVLPAELAGLSAVVHVAGGHGPWVTGPAAGSAGLPGTGGCPPTARLAAEAIPLPGLVVDGNDPVLSAAARAHPLLACGPPVVAVQRGTADPLAGAIPGLAAVPSAAGAATRTAHALAAAAHLAATVSPAGTESPGAPVLPRAAPWPGAVMSPVAAFLAGTARSGLTRHTAPPPQLTEVCEAGQVHRLLALRGWLRDLNAPGGPAVDEVLAAIGAWLASVPDLTPGGTELLGTLRAGGPPSRRPAVVPPVPGHSGRPSWRDAWQRAGGRWRHPRPEPRRLAAGELAPVLADLGCPDGIELNRLRDQRLRADPSIDHLSLARVRDRARYADLAGRIAAAAAGDARRLLLGHCAYIEERFAVAADAYAGLLLDYPGDADLWRDLTFALRHLGRPDLGQTWLFRPAEVIERASACQPDPVVLGRLLPSSAQPGTPPEAAPFAVGVLKWVEHDSDHG
jgi:hypothetical protein